MKMDSTLEELRKTKDALAAEAGDNIRRLCADTRRWAAQNPPLGPVVKDAADLRAWIEREDASVLLSRE